MKKLPFILFCFLLLAGCATYEKPWYWELLTKKGQRESKRDHRQWVKETRQNNRKDKKEEKSYERWAKNYKPDKYQDSMAFAESINNILRLSKRVDSLFGVPDNLDFQSDSIPSYGARYYNSSGYCNCLPPMDKSKGRPTVPDNHPRAKYINDTTYWEWKNISDEHPEFGKVYDLKPQYIDSIRTYDGDWIKVSKWMAEESREEDRKYTDSIFVKGSWMRVPRWVYEREQKNQEKQNQTP